MLLPIHERGEGRPVVLVHGRASNSTTWAATMPQLEGYRVLAVDLPGHGQAPAPEGEGAYSFEAQTDAVEATLATLDPGFVLVGHSMGGFVALRYALRHPGRLAGLVLEATSASNPYRNGRHKAHRTQTLEQARVAREQGMEALCDFLEARGELYEGQRERFLAMAPRAYSGVIEHNRDWPCLDEQLPSLKVPTLVVSGLLDHIFDPECRRLAERIPGARGVFLPGLGHSPHREDPAAFGAALRPFLEEVFAARGVAAGR